MADQNQTTEILIDQDGNRIPTIGDAVDRLDRIKEIDALFEGATGWGSWMVECANEREALVNWLHANGVTEVEHRFQARTADAEGTAAWRDNGMSTDAKPGTTIGAKRESHHLHQSSRNVLTKAPEDAEDIISLAIRSGVRFGVRCGCSECDATMAAWLCRIKEALLP